MTNIKTLTRYSTLILSMATVCIAISAQIAPATASSVSGFTVPATISMSALTE